MQSKPQRPTMLKFYILVSDDIGNLWRHFSPGYSNLDPAETEVIINTVNERSKRDLAQFCEDFDITYHVTESNGTPGKGKNSVLEIFSKSSHDYCVQIDGDDLLTPHGVELYKQIAALDTPPDVVCLKNQIAMTPSPDFSEKEFIPNPFFTSTYDGIDWEHELESLKKSMSFIEAHKNLALKKQFHKLADKYIEENETHCRVVFYSKKAAQYRFNEDIIIGEDTLQYYELKNAHMTNKLRMYCNDESPASYIYWQRVGSIFQTARNTDWLKMFVKECKKLEKKGMLWEEELPLLKLDYEKVPCMEDYNTKGPVGFVMDNHYVDLPINSTISSAKRLWQDHKTPMKKTS